MIIPWSTFSLYSRCPKRIFVFPFSMRTSSHFLAHPFVETCQHHDFHTVVCNTIRIATTVDKVGVMQLTRSLETISTSFVSCRHATSHKVCIEFYVSTTKFIQTLSQPGSLIFNETMTKICHSLYPSLKQLFWILLYGCVHDIQVSCNYSLVNISF